MQAIPNGTKVKYLNGHQVAELFDAIVKSSYPRYGGGFTYDIKCDGYPYIIGFALDDELFVNEQDAVEALKPYKEAQLLEKRRNLLNEKCRLEGELGEIERELCSVRTKQLNK